MNTFHGKTFGELSEDECYELLTEHPQLYARMSPILRTLNGGTRAEPTPADPDKPIYFTKGTFADVMKRLGRSVRENVSVPLTKRCNELQLENAALREVVAALDARVRILESRSTQPKPTETRRYVGQA